MKAVTDLAFWRLFLRYGGADLYTTEYVRVHVTSRLGPEILQTVRENPTGRPVIVQLLGNDPQALVRIAKELAGLAVAAIELNLGCPAPIVHRKFSGGGLLRDHNRVDKLVGTLRDAIVGKFSVKTRLGFTNPREFDDLLAIYAKHHLDLLVVHGRTVAEQYQPGVHYDAIAQAVAAVSCPVLANGGIDTAPQAQQVLRQTGARGLMIGRAAIRNPWIFGQIRKQLRGEIPTYPSGREVLAYVLALYEASGPPDAREELQVQKLKRCLSYLGVGIDPKREFLRQVLRVTTRQELEAVCLRFMDHERPMPLAPFSDAVSTD